MRLGKVFRSGAFRFSLMLAALFAASSLMLLAVVAHSLSNYAEQAAVGSLQNEAAVLAQVDRASGRVELLKSIARRRDASRDRPFRYQLIDANGAMLTNDLGSRMAKAGWGSVSLVEDRTATGPGAAEALQTLGARMPDGALLTVATDAYDVQALRQRLDRLIFWGGLGITAFALFGGYLVGGLFMRRLDSVNAAVQRIMDGNLADRLPTIGLSPEFDALSANLNRMLGRIESLMDGLRQVSTDIAHDLRTPLSRLRQQLEATKGSVLIEVYEAGIDTAIAQTDQILSIFRALLRIGALESGGGRQYFDIVDLSETMDRVFLAYHPVAEDMAKTLVARHAPNVTVDGDGELIAQMVINLIENALKHTPPGAQIVSRLTLDNGTPVVSIADNGPGIPAEERQNVLTRFYRLDRSRSTPGAGLGLALVAAVASWHEVSIALEDNAPGLKVRLAFPQNSHPTGHPSGRSVPADGPRSASSGAK